MSAFQRIAEIFSKPPDAPDLAVAQCRALSRQVPLMYAMLVANTIIVAWTHYAVAPVTLTVYLPAALVLLSMVRAYMWLRSRQRTLSIAKARANLRAMIFVGAALALGFTSWSFSLFPYGDAYLQSQIAFYMGITTIGCMFCLMHVRAAALAVGICVLGPFTAFFVASGQETLIAIAINMVVVIAVLLIILLANNRDFADLVASRNAMAHRQSETQRLLDENHRLANMDSTTGLPNRRSFDRRLAVADHVDAETRTAGPLPWPVSTWIASSRSTRFSGSWRATACCLKRRAVSTRCAGPIHSSRASTAMRLA